MIWIAGKNIFKAREKEFFFLVFFCEKKEQKEATKRK